LEAAVLGLASRLVVADRVVSLLEADTSSASAKQAAGVISEHSQWFMLGALGPALGDFVPWELPPPNTFGVQERTPYYAIWRELLRFTVGEATATPPLAGIATTLNELTSGLAEIGGKVDDHDVLGLLALKKSGLFDSLSTAAKALATTAVELTEPAELQKVQELIAKAPVIDNKLGQAPPSLWTGRDWLHWKRPGDFAAKLLATAEANPDSPAFLAYALGWQVAYATLTCGSGFVNSVAGSCYRTYWWRSRWVANFIDTWAWGYYGAGATMGEDGTPTPAYSTWPGLCSAGLHRLIAISGGTLEPIAVAEKVVADTPASPQLPLPADALPADWTTFTTLWMQAWEEAYAGEITPPALFTAERLQVGYLMTWLVLWFQTSGEVVGCNKPPSMTPPAACGSNPTPPPWTPAVSPSGTPYTPTHPNPNVSPDVGMIICEALTGLGLAAAAAVAFMPPAMEDLAGLLADELVDVNWNAIECWLYWVDVYIYNAVNILHQATVVGGFQQPYPAELGQGATVLTFGQYDVPYTPTATVNCRSRFAESLLQPWSGLLPPWTEDPVGAGGTPEPPPSNVWPFERPLWPSAVIDDTSENPQRGSLHIASEPPSFDEEVLNSSFGPAAQSAVLLITQQQKGLPNWNLDADRGYGWLTWRLATPTYSVPVNPVQE
jgi:hypothetical protein